MAELSPQMAYAIVLLPVAGCAGLLAVVVLGERIPWFFQLVKYGAIGVLSTALQTGVFYALAATCLGCLSYDDVAVRMLGMPAADVGDAVRAFRFAVATGVGFVVANVFCWPHEPGLRVPSGQVPLVCRVRHVLRRGDAGDRRGAGASSALIRWCWLMTTLAVVIEVAVSFLVNFFVRKFFIFKG